MVLTRLIAGEDLAADDAAWAMDQVMTGAATPALYEEDAPVLADARDPDEVVVSMLWGFLEVAGKDQLIDTLADKGIDPTWGVESQETRGMLAAAINSLSEREKIVVTLYYFEGLTLAEIGEILGVTESRVCQIHTKAVGGLRGQLSEFD
mgnify:CR=1 FL=1